MSDSPAAVPDDASRFFDNYLICLAKACVPEKQRRWYVKRVEGFIKAQNGRKIKALSGQDIDRYLDVLGRQEWLSGWQFAQCIHALRILYCDFLAIPAVCQEVDWEYWQASARQLELDHPSQARQLTPEELSYLKERRGDGPMNQIRTANHGLLMRFASEIRRHGYAYRTEQTYEQWIGRYLYFSTVNRWNVPVLGK